MIVGWEVYEKCTELLNRLFYSFWQLFTHLRIPTSCVSFGDIWLAFFISEACSLESGKGKDTCLQYHHTLPSSCLPHQRGQNCLPWSLTGTVEMPLQGSFSCVQLTAGNWMLVWKWKDFNELGVFMGLVFLAAINSRGYTEGQKLFFWGVSRTSLSDKIKLMWLLVLISKAAGCRNVFRTAGIGWGVGNWQWWFIIIEKVRWFWQVIYATYMYIHVYIRVYIS